MRCDEVLENLELFVLGELPVARQGEIEAHLAGCPDCRADEEECRLLVREIKLAAEKAAPTREFERAVRLAVAAEIGVERRRSRAKRVVAAVGSLAALLLLGLSIGRIWYVTRGRPKPVAVAPPGAVPVEEKQPTGHSGPAPERWRYIEAWAAPASMADGVVVQGSSMYFLRNDQAGSYVVAIDARTGELRWRSKSQSRGYLAADQSRIFCLASSGPRTLDLVALDANDGKTLWRYSRDSPRRLESPCRPVLLRGDRICWTNQSTIHMLDTKTGKPMWTHSILDEGLLSRGVAKGDHLYVASRESLYCLKVESGDESWTKRFEEAWSGQGRPVLALADKRIYFVRTRLAVNCEVFCVDLDSRELIWKRSVPRARSLLAAGETVCLRGQGILALDNRTGKPLWTYAAAGCGPLTLFDGLIHFVDSSKRGRLVAVEPRTGRKAWEIAGVRSCNAFTKVGSTGYIKTQDGIVHAMALRDRERS